MAKPFNISKHLVVQAYKLVKANADHRVLTDNHWLILKRMGKIIYTKSGIDYLQEVIFLHR